MTRPGEPLFEANVSQKTMRGCIKQLVVGRLSGEHSQCLGTVKFNDSIWHDHYVLREQEVGGSNPLAPT